MQPYFRQVSFSFGNNPAFPSFDPGTYLFAFKYLTRQIGWGIDSCGKYFTYAAPSSANQVRDGWPTPFVKESYLSHPCKVYIDRKWNHVTVEAIPDRKVSPFVTVAYYMAQNDGWQMIDEKPLTSPISNEIQFQ